MENATNASCDIGDEHITTMIIYIYIYIIYRIIMVAGGEMLGNRLSWSTVMVEGLSLGL